MSKYYIASCTFTAQFPELSARIRDFAGRRYGLESVRCCVPNYKIKENIERMPEGLHRDSWIAMPDSGDFQAGDEIYSLCHNCNNVIEETHPDVRVRSLWELIDSDDTFPFPDLEGMEATVQDCWRSRDRGEEQDAVRSLLRKMNINFRETEPNRGQTDFCGASLYRPQPPRNPKLAPKHYVEGAVGKFIPHTPEEQVRIMEDYCSRFTTETVICCCHYCLEGLKMGKVNGIHIASLLFP